jgi:hypothetical protein
MEEACQVKDWNWDVESITIIFTGNKFCGSVGFYQNEMTIG